MRWSAKGDGTFAGVGAVFDTADAADGEEEEAARGDDDGDASGAVQTCTSLPTATATYLPQGENAAAETGHLKVILPRHTVDDADEEADEERSLDETPPRSPFLPPLPPPPQRPPRRSRSRARPERSIERRVLPLGSMASVRTCFDFFSEKKKEKVDEKEKKGGMPSTLASTPASTTSKKAMYFQFSFIFLPQSSFAPVPCSRKQKSRRTKK